MYVIEEIGISVVGPPPPLDSPSHLIIIFNLKTAYNLLLGVSA